MTWSNAGVGMKLRTLMTARPRKTQQRQRGPKARRISATPLRKASSARASTARPLPHYFCVPQASWPTVHCHSTSSACLLHPREMTRDAAEGGPDGLLVGGQEKKARKEMGGQEGDRKECSAQERTFIIVLNLVLQVRSQVQRGCKLCKIT